MKKLIYGLSFICAGGLWSCETIVNIDLPEHKPVLVANSLFSPDTVFEVHVSRSQHVLDNADIADVDNAVVDLYKDGQFLVTLPSQGYGLYKAPGVYPQAESEYTLKVAASGYDAVSASDNVPVPVLISSYTITDSVSNTHGYYQAELTLTFNDPPGEDNYYLLEMMQIDTFDVQQPYYRSVGIYSVNEESASEHNFSGRIMLTDELFNGNSYTIKAWFDSRELYYLNTPGYHVKLVITLKTITRQHYLYRKTYDLHEINQGNPFAEPVRVYSNVDGGFGIFAGFSTDTVMVR